VDLLGSDDDWDPHAIAGLLKSFLRELPTSLLTRDLHLKFLGVIDLADPQERINELASLISQLPLANYSLLRALTAHLIRIVQNANENKMTMRNVGIVFSPTLGIPAGVFSLMLGEFDRVFNVNPEIGDDSDSAAAEGSSDQDRPKSGVISKRNSLSYTEGAADKMLGLTGRRLQTTAEGESDDEITLQEESGTETDTHSVDTSEPASSGEAPGSHAYKGQRERVEARVDALSNAPHRGHGASIAAARGLQVATTRPNHHAGLPASPRPNRMPHTPTSIPNSPLVRPVSPATLR